MKKKETEILAPKKVDIFLEYITKILDIRTNKTLFDGIKNVINLSGGTLK